MHGMSSIKLVTFSGTNLVGLIKMYIWDIKGNCPYNIVLRILWRDCYVMLCIHLLTLSCYSDPCPGHWVMHSVACWTQVCQDSIPTRSGNEYTELHAF